MAQKDKLFKAGKENGMKIALYKAGKRYYFSIDGRARSYPSKDEMYGEYEAWQQGFK